MSMEEVFLNSLQSDNIDNNKNGSMCHLGRQGSNTVMKSMGKCVFQAKMHGRSKKHDKKQTKR